MPFFLSVVVCWSLFFVVWINMMAHYKPNGVWIIRALITFHFVSFRFIWLVSAYYTFFHIHLYLFSINIVVVAGFRRLHWMENLQGTERTPSYLSHSTTKKNELCSRKLKCSQRSIMRMKKKMATQTRKTKDSNEMTKKDTHHSHS